MKHLPCKIVGHKWSDWYGLSPDGKIWIGAIITGNHRHCIRCHIQQDRTTTPFANGQVVLHPEQPYYAK